LYMFDLTGLTVKELLNLNNKVIKRLNELEGHETLNLMTSFILGDKVMFILIDEIKVYGFVINKNQDTISVLDTLGSLWDVPPSDLILQNN
ncbi:hypothetical protein, partial [Aliivibrio salmonicida]|uniref:hypothetical protein n=1 Tax=Aliivibrio salmonicida TaxID=40269 RepID=UPI003D0E037D